MRDANATVSFHVNLHGGPDDDGDDLERTMIQIRRDWSDFGSLTTPSTAVPEGARGVDLALVAAVAAAIPPEFLAVVVDQLFRWVTARRARSVEIVRADGSSVTLSHATATQQAALVGDGGGRFVEIVRGDGSRIKLSHATQEEQRVLVMNWVSGTAE
jgi:hypothetical protein